MEIMDVIVQFRDTLYLLIMMAAFLVSWNLGAGVLKKNKSFWAAILISSFSSALFLTLGGYLGSITEPDMIGKGLVPFTFLIVFVIINGVNMIIFVFKRKKLGSLTD